MPLKELSLGFSPCPNDTFIFYALVHGKIDTDGLTFKVAIEDVESLNRKALEKELDITKISFHAYGYLREEYVCLASGGALGKGCGPLLVARKQLEPGDLIGKKIAIPGGLTTANLLLRLYQPGFSANLKPMLFSDVMKAVSSGECDAGLLIHEGRFTYELYGLKCLIDLGEWWESETGLPIPLGGIIAKRELGTETLLKLESLIRESILYSTEKPDEAASYIKEHAQEMDEKVIRDHIGLYVNDFSLDLTEEGKKAISYLFQLAEKRGILMKPYRQDLFLK